MQFLHLNVSLDTAVNLNNLKFEHYFVLGVDIGKSNIIAFPYFCVVVSKENKFSVNIETLHLVSGILMI